MTKIEQWPPPDWTEVILTWKWIMDSNRHNLNDIFQWVLDAPGGCFHIHGKGERHDFAFRFERAEDATYFMLNLPR